MYTYIHIYIHKYIYVLYIYIYAYIYIYIYVKIDICLYSTAATILRVHISKYVSHTSTHPKNISYLCICVCTYVQIVVSNK